MSIEKQTVFKGVATALITPFYQGEIDYESLQNLIEMQIEAGVGALLVAGTTGESATLSAEEHANLVSFAARQIDGRLPLIAGCGSNSTSHACELAEAVAESGADALLAVTPYYNRTNDRGIISHYHALADATEKPLILYNVPTRTGFSMTLAHYRELAEHPNIVAVKEASPDLSLLGSLCGECSSQLDVYTGNDHHTSSAMRLGASGVISVYSNVFPRKMTEICRLCATGDWKLAYQRQKQALAGMQALFWETNPIPVKHVMSAMGLCRAEYRLPLCPPLPETARRLSEVFHL
jgi:4-hydroxy-tetrahydrodipicolinate synthase